MSEPEHESVAHLALIVPAARPIDEGPVQEVSGVNTSVPAQRPTLGGAGGVSGSAWPAYRLRPSVSSFPRPAPRRARPPRRDGFAGPYLSPAKCSTLSSLNCRGVTKVAPRQR